MKNRKIKEKKYIKKRKTKEQKRKMKKKMKRKRFHPELAVAIPSKTITHCVREGFIRHLLSLV